MGGDERAAVRVRAATMAATTGGAGLVWGEGSPGSGKWAEEGGEKLGVKEESDGGKLNLKVRN